MSGWVWFAFGVIWLFQGVSLLAIMASFAIVEQNDEIIKDIDAILDRVDAHLLAQSGEPAKKAVEGFTPEMREAYPGLCWRRLEGDYNCIQDRGHDGEIHEEEPAGSTAEWNPERIFPWLGDSEPCPSREEQAYERLDALTTHDRHSSRGPDSVSAVPGEQSDE